MRELVFSATFLDGKLGEMQFYRQFIEQIIHTSRTAVYKHILLIIIQKLKKNSLYIMLFYLLRLHSFSIDF